MSPVVPRQLGRYAVIELLGIGAFATVFRARDDRLDADVAIKVLAENHSFNPDLREPFSSEGHLLRRVDRPHVVKVFDLAALQDAVRPPPAPPLEASVPPPSPAEVDRSLAPRPGPARTVGPLRLALLTLVVRCSSPAAGGWAGTASCPQATGPPPCACSARPARARWSWPSCGSPSAPEHDLAASPPAGSTNVVTTKEHT